MSGTPLSLVPKSGRLVYVMGPSGAGKDSVIGFVREAANPQKVAVAHRYITRPALSAAENHIALSEREFEARRQAGWFALNWHSHGLNYGIGREIDLWLGSGRIVIINGSRAHLPEAAGFYPDLLPVLVTAPPEIRLARLQDRKRESGGDIQARIDRKVDLGDLTTRIVEIDNSLTLDVAGVALLRLLDTATA